MAEQYLHTEINVCQSSKSGKLACGDTTSVIRQDKETTVILCDGIGSGLTAHIASKMCKSRLETLLSEGFSFYDTFISVAGEMEKWKQPSKPYAAFMLAQIRTDGYVSIMGYEIPSPVWLTSQQAVALPCHSFMQGGISGWQANCYMRSGEGLFFFSDGITQAGIGFGLSDGWQLESIVDYINSMLKRGKGLSEIGSLVHRRAYEYDNMRGHDDMTVITAQCRCGRTLNIFTGPPKDKLRDRHTVEKFMSLDGSKVVCGATTASIFSSVLDRKVEMESSPSSLITPPKYFIQGIDLVTEGAITLNQLNNVLDLHAEDFDEINAVTELYYLLLQSDRIRFFVGTGKNPANSNICFVQRGVLSRRRIVPLIADKLRLKDKCVIIEMV